jgi:hypothetical protein
MAGLLSDVLPFLYSQGDRAKRHLAGLLADPLGSIEQTAGGIVDAGRAQQGLLAQAFANPQRPFQVTNEPALAQASQNALTGPLGFAPAGIVAPEFVRALGKSAALPANDLFPTAVANTPGARIADDGLYMRLQRNQHPDQSMRPSVRGGVFYLPEGAAQAKHYSTGKNGYGGSERIAGETLIQSPLFVKGATGGKAPQMAYDEMLGKGSYEAMRTEALNKTMGWGVTPAMKVERVEEFLDVYAPELSGMGQYIVQNSAKGNQLPYALQEAAVASAARNAGHDAILGYSVNRAKQPFLSEVFDVREKAYPDKFGGFKVWE